MSGVTPNPNPTPKEEEDKKPDVSHIRLMVKQQMRKKRKSMSGVTPNANANANANPNPNSTPRVEEDMKPNVSHISLKIKRQDGVELPFKIKRNTKLKDLIKEYCDQQSLDMNTFAFLFDGRQIKQESTPDELQMEDGDEIDAMLHQWGGGALLI